MRRGLARACVCAAFLAVFLAVALPAHAAFALESQKVEPAPTLARPSSPTKPPANHFLSATQVIEIAAREDKLLDELAKHDRVRREVFVSGPGLWQLSYYAEDDEVAQVIVDERKGRAVEVWTGPQVAWQMARGLPGAFGRKVNSPAIWIPLMVAFFVPFFDRRRPFRMLHLDLLVLLAFSISHIFFSRGEIFTSVPLVYPVLAYLLVRLLFLAYARLGGRPREPLRMLVPFSFLVLGLVFLVGFRVGLNLTNSNVIDVGYSGVIGADRLVDGDALYGGFPADDPSGDTYGPVNYYAYVPFEQALPWSGKWDDLPAAHGAALFFDLATLVALFWVGRRLAPGREGSRLGVVLAYAWASYPYTLFALSSNANDALVALLVVLAFGALASPRARGALLALAAATKFAPLALAPLFASYHRRRVHEAVAFALTLAAVLIVAFAPVIPGDGLRAVWDRTVGFQLGRDSPFSIWGQHAGLGWAQDVAKVAALGLALTVAIVPARKTPLQLAALGAAVLIAVQLTLSHWFYLYVVWWFPLAAIAFLARPLAGSFDGSLSAAAPPSRAQSAALSTSPGPTRRSRSGSP
jgi:glycosyl transferase family 87